MDSGLWEILILGIFVFKCLDLLIVITHYVFVCRKPAVIMIVGVNGGGKTTSLGMFDDNGYQVLFCLVIIIMILKNGQNRFDVIIDL